MDFGFIPATVDVEVSDDGTISIIYHYEDNRQLSDLIRY